MKRDDLMYLILMGLVAFFFWALAWTAEGQNWRCTAPEPVCPVGTAAYCVCPNEIDIDNCRWVCAYIDGEAQ
jgi:hypothetical protein